VTPSTELSRRHDVVQRINNSYRALRSALESLPRDRFTEKLRTGWSLNENIAHLAAWEETVPKRVAGVLEGGEDPKLYEDIDGFNASVAKEARGKTTDELLARWAAAHERVLETVQEIPEDADKLAFEIVEWNTTGHYPDHYGDIGAAMLNSASERSSRARCSGSSTSRPSRTAMTS